MNTSHTTRYQAVRTALQELGPLATLAEVAQYVRDHHGFEFEDPKTVSLYVAMVKSKMSRKPLGSHNSPSGSYSITPR